MQDTYYVVAHFHYVLVAGSLFAMFAGFYYWSPKWTGVMYNESRGKIHFWGSLLSFNITFFPMHAQQPWDAAQGLEWEVPSPAPFHTFETPPRLNEEASKVIWDATVSAVR